jgi:hypothetical protein
VNRHVEKSTIDDEEKARNMTMVSPHLERIDEQSDGKQYTRGKEKSGKHQHRDYI